MLTLQPYQVHNWGSSPLENFSTWCRVTRRKAESGVAPTRSGSGTQRPRCLWWLASGFRGERVGKRLHASVPSVHIVAYCSHEWEWTKLSRRNHCSSICLGYVQLEEAFWQMWTLLAEVLFTTLRHLALKGLSKNRRQSIFQQLPLSGHTPSRYPCLTASLGSIIRSSLYLVKVSPPLTCPTLLHFAPDITV